MLKEKYGTVSALNVAIGWESTSARLSQILNGSVRSGRGTPYEMGDSTARLIEEKLQLQIGWMDTPPSYTDSATNNQIAHVVKLLEAMPQWQREQAVKIVDALAQPANGTTGAIGPTGSGK